MLLTCCDSVGYRPKSVYGSGVSGVFSGPSLSEFDAVFVGESGVVFCWSDGFVGLCVGVWFWWVPVGFGDEVPGVFGVVCGFVEYPVDASAGVVDGESAVVS